MVPFVCFCLLCATLFSLDSNTLFLQRFSPERFRSTDPRFRLGRKSSKAANKVNNQEVNAEDIALVLTVTPDFLQSSWPGTKSDLTALNCYASTTHHPIFWETMVPFDHMDMHFMTARLFNVRKHLQFHQWVVHLDGDTIPLDYSSGVDPLTAYVRSNSNFDVLLQWLDNGQLCSGGFAVQDTPGGWAFLDKWITKGNRTDPPGPRPNADQGDLIELLTEWASFDCVGHGFANTSHNLRDTDFKSFQQCFHNAYSFPPGLRDLAVTTSDGVPIRIRMFRSLEGFFRNIASPKIFYAGYTKFAARRRLPTVSGNIVRDVFGTGKHLDAVLSDNEIICPELIYASTPHGELEVTPGSITAIRMAISAYNLCHPTLCFSDKSHNASPNECMKYAVASMTKFDDGKALQGENALWDVFGLSTTVELNLLREAMSKGCG